MIKNRELIISPKVSMPQLGKFLQHLENEGLHIVYVDPKKISKIKTKLSTIYPSAKAKYVILDKESSAKPKGKKVGKKFKVLSNKDIDKIL
ncbi:MAG: 3-dehydroquinate synthase, partial [Nitrosopumilus sp.]